MVFTRSQVAGLWVSEEPVWMGVFIFPGNMVPPNVGLCSQLVASLPRWALGTRGGGGTQLPASSVAWGLASVLSPTVRAGSSTR